MRNMDRSLGDGGMPLLGQLGVTFDRYGEGWAEATWVPTADACNPGGPVHGGVYAVVHDAAMNFATNAALERGDRAATISITYATMRPAAQGHPLAVRGEVTRITKQVAYLETTITNADGDVVSKATGSFILRRRESAPVEAPKERA
ncbi:MAG: PaaI family thioesterase [Actinobacteria bacterium]|nr:PaaI family thioesterase [Actinomycetota bacterium]